MLSGVFRTVAIERVLLVVKHEIADGVDADTFRRWANTQFDVHDAGGPG